MAEVDMLTKIKNAEYSNNFLWKILKHGLERTQEQGVIIWAPKALARFERLSGKDTNEFLEFGSNGNIRYLDLMGDGKQIFIGQYDGNNNKGILIFEERDEFYIG